MAERKLRLRLSASQRRLLLTYSMPFEPFQAQLQALASYRGTAILTIEPFYLERLLADLVYSAKRIQRTALLEELDELYTELENQARQQGVSV